MQLQQTAGKPEQQILPLFGTFIVKYILFFLAFVFSTAQHWHLVQALKVYLSLHLVVNTEIRLGGALCQNFAQFVKYLMPHFKEVNYDI